MLELAWSHRALANMLTVPMTFVIVIAGATDPLGFLGDLSAQLARLLLEAVHKIGFLVAARVVPAEALLLVLRQIPNTFVFLMKGKRAPKTTVPWHSSGDRLTGKANHTRWWRCTQSSLSRLVMVEQSCH